MDDINDHLEEMESYARELRHSGRNGVASSIESFISAYRRFSQSGRHVPKHTILEVLRTGDPVLLRKMVRIMNRVTPPKDVRDWEALALQAKKVNRQRVKAKKRGLRK